MDFSLTPPRQVRDGPDLRGTRPAPMDRGQSRIRPRIFEPNIPEEITGEELDKSLRAELLSPSAENAKIVARYLECLALYATYRAGFYKIALKELPAAHRISGDVTMWPVMADCERGQDNPLKA